MILDSSKSKVEDLKLLQFTVPGRNLGSIFLCLDVKQIQFNLDLVTLLVSAPQKMSLNYIMSLYRMILCSKLKMAFEK